MAEKKIICRVTGLKGECSAGHKVGDEIEVSSYKASNLCGLAYNAILPFIVMMEYGGKASWQEDENVMTNLACPDAYNLLTMELIKMEK